MPNWFSAMFKSGRVNPTSTGTLVDILGDETTGKYDSKDLVALNNGWAGICNAKNAQTMASVPLKLYYHNKTGNRLKLTPTNTLTSLKAQRISKYLNISLKQNQVVDEILEHPLLELLSNVNAKQNKTDLIEIVGQYLGCIGNSYVKIILENNLPSQLEPLLSEYVTVFTDSKSNKTGNVTGYEYRVPGNKVETYKPEEVIHFLNYIPGNMVVGRGELETCLSAVDRMNQYNLFESYILKNKSVPDSVWDFTKPLSAEDKKDLLPKIRERFSGNRNVGKPILLNGNDLKITELGKSPRDMQYQVGRTWAREEIAAAFGVPLPLLTVTDVNRANAVMGSNFYMRYTIMPKMFKLCEKLNEILLPLYGQEGLYIWPEEVYMQDDADVVNNFTSGIIDKNEARSALGYEPIEENNSEE